MAGTVCEVSFEWRDFETRKMPDGDQKMEIWRSPPRFGWWLVPIRARSGDADGLGGIVGIV